MDAKYDALKGNAIANLFSGHVTIENDLGDLLSCVEDMEYSMSLFDDPNDDESPVYHGYVDFYQHLIDAENALDTLKKLMMEM